MLLKKIGIAFIATTASIGIAFAGDGSLPDSPLPGQCFVHKWFPPVITSGTQEIVTKDGFTDYSITLPVFENATQEVPVGDPWNSWDVTPAVFNDTTETITIEAGGGLWGITFCDSPNGDEGEQVCYKEVQPVTEEVTVEKLITDAIATPIVVEPGTITVPYLKVVEPATLNVLDIPPETATYTITAIKEPGQMLWVEGECTEITIP